MMATKRLMAPVALVIAAGLGLVLGSASASQMAVDGGSLSTVAGQACTTAAVPVTPSTPVFFGIVGYRTITVVVPASCAGRSLEVTVYATASGAVQATASAASVPAGTIVLTASATYGAWFNTGNAFAIVFDGWSAPVA